ncbi:hypothetical protein NG799_25805 [Laspinema sp. D1]|uniref:Uncharacterized protein n=1 Tax=Laspinema palackyanum D2a TaxID=2953684 RepID=A0ABT2MYA9_9CYAN|nr:hypothetical protein [Laspinema sp. D2a]
MIQNFGEPNTERETVSQITPPDRLDLLDTDYDALIATDRRSPLPNSHP